MNHLIHKAYILSMVLVVLIVTVYLAYTGYDYYVLPIEERFYHPRYDWFKPAGVLGHGIGILGTLLILFGVVIYIARKRYNFLQRYIRLKYLLEFHIFLCTLGPILIVFHTSFKIGGLVSIAFWAMVAVVLSGVIGRFIYVQIPRTIEGKEISLGQLKEMTKNLMNKLKAEEKLSPIIFNLIEGTRTINSFSVSGYIKNLAAIQEIKNQLRRDQINKVQYQEIISTVKEEISLTQKLNRLDLMQKLFGYWHVAHLPFALIMLLIVIIHVIVTLAFGYKWIF